MPTWSLDTSAIIAVVPAVSVRTCSRMDWLVPAATLMGMRTPKIELLWWAGCPSTERALAQLREALADVGLGEAEIVRTEIRADADERAVGFSGSPTILVDGVDVARAGRTDPVLAGDPGTGRTDPATGRTDLAPGADPGEPVALSCRVYPRRDGRISPTPDPDDLRDALRRAATAPDVQGPAAADPAASGPPVDPEALPCGAAHVEVR